MEATKEIVSHFPPEYTTKFDYVTLVMSNGKLAWMLKDGSNWCPSAKNFVQIVNNQFSM